jgi:hypothetical protein
MTCKRHKWDNGTPPMVEGPTRCSDCGAKPTPTELESEIRSMVSGWCGLSRRESAVLYGAADALRRLAKIEAGARPYQGVASGEAGDAD